MVLFGIVESAAATVDLPKNIVVVLTDDQDVTLGGWHPMNKTRALIKSAGILLHNHFANTPVCCPSRATLLSGQSLRSVRTVQGCMHVDIDAVNSKTFSAMLGAVGYANAYFGKQLNQCVAAPPPGFNCSTCRWFAYDGGPDVDPYSYVNASFHDWVGGVPHTVDTMHPTQGVYAASDIEFAGYTTAIIGNKSLEWVAHAPAPFSLIIGHRAPHVPATPAPWYENAFDGLGAPRDPAFNASGLENFHWLIAQQPIISIDQAKTIDQLFRDRWRTLLSVDDHVSDLARVLDFEETYLFFTSDHGYQLGQHRLPSCKLNVYDHDIRVPMAIVGPGLKGSKHFASSHLDLMPTILTLAAQLSCDHCQGTDLTPFLRTRRKRSALVIVEYYSLGNLTRTEHLVDDTNSNTYRALRFVRHHAYGNFLYAQFTSLADWDYHNVTFYEAFNLTADPHQLKNIYAELPSDIKRHLANDIERSYSLTLPLGALAATR